MVKVDGDPRPLERKKKKKWWCLGVAWIVHLWKSLRNRGDIFRKHLIASLRNFNWGKKTNPVFHITGKAGCEFCFAHDRGHFFFNLSFIWACLFHSRVYFILCCCKQALSISPYGMIDGLRHPQISNFQRTCILTNAHRTPRTRFSVGLLRSCILFWTSHYWERDGGPMLAWSDLSQGCTIPLCPRGVGCYEEGNNWGKTL